MDIHIQSMEMDVWTLVCGSELLLAMGEQEPDHVGAGSQLMGVLIEAVDENVVDSMMDGTVHNLKLDWNPNISVPLHHGRCSLPPIPTNPGTTVQVEMQLARLGTPPGSHAATILLQAQREQHSEIVTEDIIGIVALLGAVESEEINRALVEFLGLENMVAIICGSESAAECIGAPSPDGTLDKCKLKGLFGFAKSRNLQISGRFRVIALTDQSSFYTRLDGQAAVDYTHPQKLLRMGQIDSKPGSERSVGSLGYAVNMVHLNEDQLRIRVSGHGLRESLFFVLFGFLEVFDTTNNMLRAYRVGKCLRCTAVSLDGGLIRKRNQFELGSREWNPAVWFPAVKSPSGSTTQKNVAANPLKRKSKPFNITKPVQLTFATMKRNELMQKMDVVRQRYFAGGVEEGIQNVTEQLRHAYEMVGAINRDIKNIADVHGHSMGGSGHQDFKTIPAKR